MPSTLSWTTLAMLAHAFLAVATAIERGHTPTPDGLIELTVNEFRRLFDAAAYLPAGSTAPEPIPLTTPSCA